MKKIHHRRVIKKVKGIKTQDGAGVSLVRVLGNETVKDFDPILMLDSFDSKNPDDYTAGFPMHPHRGIETISYLDQGEMRHKDSLGNEDAITGGEVQWMTAGSGILHEEQLPPADRLLGVQLWLNLPKDEKMTQPAYRSIRKDSIPEIQFDGGYLRLLAGSYKEYQGYQPAHLPLDYYDLHLQAGKELSLEMRPDDSVMAFTLLGKAVIGGEAVDEKTAVKLSAGEDLKLKAGPEGSQILVMVSKALDEPVAWAGPIVMNSRSELLTAFDELEAETFIKDEMDFYPGN